MRILRVKGYLRSRRRTRFLIITPNIIYNIFSPTSIVVSAATASYFGDDSEGYIEKNTYESSRLELLVVHGLTIEDVLLKARL